MKALYREFRPRLFKEVCGQSRITDVLRAQLKNGAPGHAYLFSGPRGTGKTSTARILAAALNCSAPKDGEPCLKCESCRSILEGRAIDVVEIDAASNNSVDNIRDLRENANLLPALGRYKIYIIDEVHMLSKSAFNALLKTLEEPPPHIVFILATTELRKLPPTVISRCLRFDFRRIDEASIAGVLAGVLQKLGRSADEAALALIARAADGALRDALSILDKCVGSSEGELTEATVRDALGLAGGAEVAGLACAIRGGALRDALDCAQSAIELGAEPLSLVLSLMNALEADLERSLDEADAARALVRAIEVLAAAENRMKYSSRPAIILKAAILRTMLPETEAPAAESERLARLERTAEQLTERIDGLENNGGLPFGGLEGIFSDNNITPVD